MNPEVISGSKATRTELSFFGNLATAESTVDHKPSTYLVLVPGCEEYHHLTYCIVCVFEQRIFELSF